MFLMHYLGETLGFRNEQESVADMIRSCLVSFCLLARREDSVEGSLGRPKYKVMSKIFDCFRGFNFNY
jgi:hypothetical protein